MRRGGKNSLNTKYTATHIIIFMVLFMGTVTGSIVAGRFYNESFNIYSQNIYESFRSMDMAYDRLSELRDSFFKYLRTIVLVWVLGFLYGGVFFQGALIGLRGFFVGYSVSVFVIQFGAGGLLLAIAAVLAHNIFLIIICFWIALKGKRSQEDLAEKFFILLFSLIGAVIISLYEVYIIPPICLLIFNALN